MTFVTANPRQGENQRWIYSRRSRLSFQGVQIADDDAAAIDLDDSLGLQAGEIAGNQFAHSADLRRQFLVADGQNDFDPFRRCVYPLFARDAIRRRRGGGAPW